MVVFDATILLFLLNEKTRPPLDLRSGRPVVRCRERVDHLLNTLEEARTKVVIPTPCLSEVLVHAGPAGPAYLSILERRRFVRISAFDKLAAIEAAELQKELLAAGGSIKLGAGTSRAKAKFDVQIMAIARVESATTVYSDDEDIRKLGRRTGIDVIGISVLPLPPEDPQGAFDLPGGGTR